MNKFCLTEPGAYVAVESVKGLSKTSLGDSLAFGKKHSEHLAVEKIKIPLIHVNTMQCAYTDSEGSNS